MMNVTPSAAGVAHQGPTLMTAPTMTSTVVSGDADALVSRILTYPDLSLLADGGTGGAGPMGSNGANQSITMYAVTPTPPAVQPSVMAPVQQPQQQFQVVQGGVAAAPPQVAAGATDYLCHDCNMVFGDVNSFLQHISHGHQDPNIMQLVSEPQNLTVKQEPAQAATPATHHQTETIQVLRCNYCTLTFHDTPAAKRALMDHVSEVHMAPLPAVPVPQPAATQVAPVPAVAMQPHVIVQAADGTQHLVPASSVPGATLASAAPVPAAAVQPTLMALPTAATQPSEGGDYLPVPLSGSGEGLFCPHCRNPFANKYSLTKHLRSTSKCRHDNEIEINKIINDQLTCGKCLKLFGSMQPLQKHMEANKCQAVTDRVEQQYSQVPVYHPDQSMVVTGVMEGGQQAVMSDPTMQPVNLTEATKQIGQAAPTNKEQISAKGLVIDESVTLTPGATVQVYRCPVATCTKPCVTLRAFKMHAKCVHKNSDTLQPTQELTLANFICKVRGCGKLFVEESQLDVHMKHHESYTPRTGKHKCNICQEAFYQRDMLKRHVLSTHNEVSDFKVKGRRKPKPEKPVVSATSHVDRTASDQQQENLNPADTKTDEVTLRYDMNLKLEPGTKMTIYKCPVDMCKKRSCTDIKSFKLHCLHIHKNKEILPLVEEVEAKHICRVEGCGKLYLEKKQFEIHQRHHKSYVPSKGRYFKCPNCDSKFNTQGNLDVHMIHSHMSNGSGSSKNELIFEDVPLEPGTMMRVYHCPVAPCNKRNYLDSKSVRTHCRRVHGMIDYEGVATIAEAQFICQVRGCKKLFMETVQIEAHLKHHRNYVPTNGVFDCKVCTESFTRKEHLDKHTLMRHTVSGSTVIQQQPTVTVPLQSQHQQIVTGADGIQYLVPVAPQPQHLLPQEPLPPSVVRPSAAPMSVVLKQTGKVQGYQCSICMKKFLHLGTHANHVNNMHHAPGMAPLEVEIKPRYTCKMAKCGRHFMTKNMFKAHMDRHANGKSKKAMNCFKCGRNFSQFKSLYQHLIQTHSDVTQAEIDRLEASHAKCPVCNAVFRSVDIMKVHLRRHEQDQQQPVALGSAPDETVAAISGGDDESKLRVDEDMDEELEEDEEEEEPDRTIDIP